MPSWVPGEADHGPVAVLRRAVLDRRELGVLVAQLLDDLVDLGLVDRLDLGREVELRVVAELDLGADLDGRLEAQRLALLGVDDLDVRVGERDDPLLDDRLAVRVLDEVLDGLVDDRGGAEDALEDRPRGLAGTEARRPACGGTGARRRRGRRGRTGRRGPRSRGGSSSWGRGWRSHSSPGEYRVGRRCGAAASGAGRTARRRAGRRGRTRTDTPLTGHRLLRPARLPFRHSPEWAAVYRPAGPPTVRPGDVSRGRRTRLPARARRSPARGSSPAAPRTPPRSVENSWSTSCWP